MVKNEFVKSGDMPYYEEEKEINFSKTVLNESIRILSIVENSGNKELYNKFLEEHKDVFRSIVYAKKEGKEISIYERKKILLELSDMVKLAEVNGIDKYKKENSIINKISNLLGKNKKEEENKKSLSNDIRKNNINSMDREEAIITLEYLNSNYYSFHETNEENSIIDKGLGKIYTATNIENIKNKTQLHNFQKALIQKSIGKEVIPGKTYNDEYIHGFNNTIGNHLIKIDDFEKTLKNGNIEYINSIALANYFGMLGEKGKIMENLMEIFSGKNLMGLAQLWSKDTDENLIAKNIIKNSPNGQNIIDTVLIFKDLNSINNEMFKNTNDNGTIDFEKNKLFFSFLNKNKDFFKDTQINNFKQIFQNLKKGKNSEEIKKIEIVEKNIITKIEGLSNINPDKLNLVDIIIELNKELKGLGEKNYKELMSNNELETIIGSSKELISNNIIFELGEIKKEINTINELQDKLKVNKALINADRLIAEKESLKTLKKELEKKVKKLNVKLNSINLESITLNELLKDGNTDINRESFDKKVQEIRDEIKSKEESELTENQRNFKEYNCKVETITESGINDGTITLEEAEILLKESHFQEEEIIQFKNNIFINNPELNTQTQKKSENNSNNTNIDGNKIINSNENKITSEKVYFNSNIDIENNVITIKNNNSISELPISQKDSQLAQKNEKFKENLFNFVGKLKEVGLEDFWQYKDQIFQSINNKNLDIKSDNEHLDGIDYMRFVNAILISLGKIENIGELPKIDVLENKLKTLNFGSLSSNTININEKGETNIFTLFREKYVNDGKFIQSDFEKNI
ncbi:MAG: hypothetical protein NWP80_01620 [Candidatus Gracilibacteria bacterium]|nr:hypothetical protein [Candidatus Gracilibacteria bacterium]